ncbi:MAG: oxygen-independent coproporphyrinogen-3 oxidase [Cellvibrionaceae bacterium]|jgi:oxygen-independent coproporphyrinogen-3 oxidase
MNYSQKVSLYLHIPFCTYRCSYCDFNTYTTLGDVQSEYADALAAEVAYAGQAGQLGQNKKKVQTIFFGGGTPSVMSHADLSKIFDSINQNFDIDADAEITLETNPETIDLDYMRGLNALGVNRISFGAQSALTEDLAVLGRQHSFDTVVTGVDLARQSGIDNLSIDLIYGVPGQTVASIEKTLDAVLPLGLPHLSLYCLTVEPGTPLHREVNSGRIPPPDPDLAADQYDAVSERLDKAGMNHYEISNWAISEHESRHNLAYWYNAEYLGLGAGAHGHAGGHRYHIVRRPRTYIRRMTENSGEQLAYPLTPAVAENNVIDPTDEIADTIIMGLRLLKEGLNSDQFSARFGVPIQEMHGETISDLIELGLLTWQDGANGQALLLTEKGRFISNQVFHRFI